MEIDESRRHQRTRRCPARRPGPDGVVDLYDQSPIDSDVGSAPVGVPVPSTSVPPRIATSCCTLNLLGLIKDQTVLSGHLEHELADHRVVSEVLEGSRQLIKGDDGRDGVAQPSISDQRGQLSVDPLQVLARVSAGEHADQ